MRFRCSFPNGYGASVINDGYGSKDGLFELAVLGPDGRINYDTALTPGRDVLGWLTADQVVARLAEISALRHIT